MTDKIREEFVGWYSALSGLTVVFDDYNVPYDGTKSVTSNTAIQAAWLSWKASREGMKAIELPDQADYFSVEYDNDESEIIGFDIESYSSDVCDAITSAGYKVEE